MRWQVKANNIEKGRIETLTKFLWFPMRIGDEVRWLEKATWERIWKIDVDGNGRWVGRKWWN
jgi:hypothetical protein